jgi:HAE1 family hydrophobic/amphiphilic exporter-1
VVIDRDSASSLGITSNQIETALYSAYGLRQVSTIYAPNNQYRVIMELAPEYQHDANALAMLHVRSNTGALIPLSGIAKLTDSLGPLSVNHLGQLPAVTISFTSPAFPLASGESVSRRRKRAAFDDRNDIQGNAHFNRRSPEGNAGAAIHSRDLHCSWYSL